MHRQRKLFFAKVAAVFSVVPVLIWAHEYGPDAGYTNVPRELGNCSATTCHTGSISPANRGSVEVGFPGGLFYLPGVKQRLTVTISDPAPTQRAWGFQLTPRLASNSGTLAGTLSSPDKNTTLMCASADLFNQREVPFSPTTAQTCPPNPSRPLVLQYIEHSLDGYNATNRQSGGATYTIDWTPPATNVGDITFYVAGNATNGDLQSTGDHVYLNTYTVKPLAFSGPPAISGKNVQSLGDFGSFSTMSPGTWIEIFGSNLSATTRQWGGGDFNGSNAPTSLDGVKVTVGGKQAFVYYVSPTQVNALAPSDVGVGPQPVAVSTGGGDSPPFTITVNDTQPGLLAPASFNIGGRQNVVAQFTDGSFVLPPGAIPGLNTRQAKPGETILIYGIGFGPAATASGQTIPAGQIVGAANQLTNSFRMDFGQTAATLSYAGLSPGFVGLYQFNVTVPSVPDSDSVPLSFVLNGKAGPQSLVIAVKR